MRVGGAIREFDSVLTRWESFGFWGGVLVLERARALLKKSYGFSRWADGVPNTADTLFPVASITKQFTAAAILKLELDGRLLTSDPVGNYLGAFPGEQGITTIHHLLTHTSGLIRSDTSFESGNSREYVEKLKQAPRESPPGEKHRYANGGYSLLAAIIEEVSGMNFQSYLREHLFLPAGMEQTRFIDEVDFDDPKVARGHSISESQIVRALESDSPSELQDKPLAKGLRPLLPVFCDWSIITSGGVVTTLHDMEKWEQELTVHNILSRDAVNRFTAPYVKIPDGGSSHQSYSWTVGHTTHGIPFAGIYGDYRGYQSAYIRYTGGEFVLFLACNSALEEGGPGGWRLPVRDLFERLFVQEAAH